jgi:uncharacterized membrane protein YozB (DUF420 family)
MTATAPDIANPAGASSAVPSYGRAHWYFLAALGVLVAGFWPSFFRPMGAGDIGHTLHGITATLWVVALMTQSFLMSRGDVQWHRRIGRTAAFVLLPVLSVSALHMVRVMFANTQMPPILPPLLAFIDIPSVLFLVILVTLGLRNVRTPEAHKRFMASTVLLAFPPALTRLYQQLGIDFFPALHGSFFTVEAILLVLILADRRAGVRRAAYPMSLAFFVAVHALMMPVSSSAPWLAFSTWFSTV